MRILCFGDSNTWGYSPSDGSRYPSNVRWTGVLQSLLGDGYQIIEEGLNGRTTDIDYADRMGRNGRSYLSACMDSHWPLDYVILNLGTNDTKVEFCRLPEAIATAMEGLIRIVQGAGLETPSPNVKIILVGPTEIKEGLEPYGDQLKGASAKIREIVELYRALAKRFNLLFVDLFSNVSPSSLDGVHLSAEAHQQIARIFFETIRRDGN